MPVGLYAPGRVVDGKITNHGFAILEVVIDEFGNVAKVRAVLRGAPDVVARAKASVPKWKFAPATCEGRPVACIYNLSYE